MSVNRIESLVDAISKSHGCPHNPESVSYQLRNPLMIKSFARPGKHETNEDGVRMFSSLLAGYKAATFDVKLKAEGKSRAGLKPTDALENLLAVYGIKLEGVSYITSFLRRALKDDSISGKTPLSFFLEGENESVQH